MTTSLREKTHTWKLPIQITPPWDDTSPRTIRATANQLKPFFNLKPGQPWPAEGMTPRAVKGIVLFVRPLGKLLEPQGPYWRKNLREGLNSRLMAYCPDCQALVSYGRLHQHMAACQGGK